MSRERLDYRIIAVDDGSIDDSAEVLRAFAARSQFRIISHPRNRGLGATIRTGVMEAIRTATDDEAVIVMDSDESHTPALIATMLRALNAGNDVVIASRYQSGSRTVGVPFHRRVLSFSASCMLRVLLPTPGVRDFTCGYRAYRATVLRRALEQYGDSLFELDGFECMVDLLLKLRSMGARFCEAPAVLRYDLKKGASKMRVFRTGYRTIRLILRRMAL